MAGFDYVSTYYTTYFWFVTDSDAGQGTEPATLTVRFTAAGETAHGADSAGTVFFFFTDTDTGSAADASSAPRVRAAEGGSGAEAAQVAPQAADVSHPAADNGGITGGLFTLADADVLTSTEMLASTALSSGDVSNAVEVDQVSDSDTASAADAAVVSLAAADAWSGADAATIKVLDTDAVHVADFGQSFGIQPAAGDTGAGLDANNQIGFPISSSDTGAGLDAVLSVLPDILDSDAGAAAENSTIHAALSSADAGSALDANVARPDTDSGTFTDLGQLHQTGADAFTAADTAPIPPAKVLDADAGTVVEGSSVNTPFKFDGDVLHGTEGTPSFVVRLSSADAGRAIFENSLIQNADLVFGTEESFSVTRAAVLLPGSGAELAQLPGVRDGTLTPQVSVISTLADDTEILTWADISVVEVQVDGGFVSFPALSTIMGFPVSSSGPQFSVPVGVRSAPSSAELPLVLRTASRDYRGTPRTLDLVLYRVRFTSLTVEGYSYKNGVIASWTGVALQANFDETGSPLTGNRKDFGRLVSSPGQLPGPIPAALFGNAAKKVTFVSSADSASFLDGKPNALPTLVSSADAANPAIESTGKVSVGASSFDAFAGLDAGAVTSSALSSSDAGALLDGKPASTVQLVADIDTGHALDAQTVLNGAARSDVEVFHAVEGASAQVRLSDTDIGGTGTNPETANVNVVGGTSFITDSDSMFNNEHPATGEQSTYIQIFPTGGPTKVAQVIGADLSTDPAGAGQTWAGAMASLGNNIQGNRIFYSSLPATYSAGGRKLLDPAQDGSVTQMLSFKTVDTTALGTHSGPIWNFVLSIPNAVPVWLIFHHEPEGDFTDGSIYVSQFISQAALIRQAMAGRADNGVNIKVVSVNGGFPYTNNKGGAQTGSYIVPGTSAGAKVLDYRTLDCYPFQTYTASTNLAQSAEWTGWIAAMALVGEQGTVPLGLTEYGIDSCQGNTIRNDVITNDAAYLRRMFPAQGSHYSGALGPGTSATGGNPVSPFPMICWNYWWNDTSGGVIQTACSDLWQFTDTATINTWIAIENGTI